MIADKELLSAIGRIAIQWNELEKITDAYLRLYVDIDEITSRLIFRQMRSVDKEKLIRALIDEKETDENAIKENKWFLDCVATYRENRNTLIHQIDNVEENLTESVQRRIISLADSLEIFLDYSQALFDSSQKFWAIRADRELPIDGMSGPDEERPLESFEAPDRPEKPRKFSFRGVD
jgi:hypothetical protein